MVATDKQIKYIEILAIDLGLDIHRRNALINDKLSKKIKFLDELSTLEASIIIDYFKRMRMEGELL